jgi:regulator of nonsense transcripts 1
MDSFDNFQYDTASSYGGIGVVDDTSSIYTSDTQNHVPVDIEGLSLLDDHVHPPSSMDNDLELQSTNGSIAEDFDAVLDDLKEEGQVDLPLHACWFVLYLTARSGTSDKLRSAIAAYTTRPPS